MIKILAVDDDFDFHALLKLKLASKDYELVLTSTEKEFFEKFGTQKFDIFLLDLSLDNHPLKGLEMLTKIRSEKNVSTPVIVLSNSSSQKTVASALELGASGFVNKPLEGNVLNEKINFLVNDAKVFSSMLNKAVPPTNNRSTYLTARLRLVAITEIGFLAEGNVYIAKGARIQLRSERIKKIFETDMIYVYSTGFSTEVSGVYLTNFEIDPEDKDVVTKIKTWIASNKKDDDEE